MTSPGALGTVTVVEASDTVAGQFAARLLADYGADVTSVEPPGGSWVRREPPFLAREDGGNGDAAGPDSLLHWHLNAGKRAVSLDLVTEAGRDRLGQLASVADIAIVTDHDLAAELTARHPDTVVATISDFGSTGPYAGWQGCELVHQALSGSMYVNGEPGRPPLYGVGHRTSYAAGLWVVIGALAALHAWREDGTQLGPIEVTVHEAAAAMEQNFTTQWAYSATYPVRGESERARARGRVRCRDGWVVFFGRAGQWPALCRAFGAPHLADDPRFSSYSGMVRNWSAATALLQEHARNLGVATLLEAAITHRLTLAPVYDPAMLWHDEHLAVRRFWERVPTRGGERIALGPLFRPARTPAVRYRPAPACPSPCRTDPSASLASTTAAPTPVRSGLAMRGGPGPASRSRRRSPLAGVTVLDLTTAWAGPMATRILAHLGAEVVKVESPDRLDDWRGDIADPAIREWYPEGQPGGRPYDRHAWFNTQNHDKRSLVLDLKDRWGLALMRRMLPWFDVLVTNFSPGTLGRLGLAADALCDGHDQLVVVEMSAAGNAGPRSSQRGVGPTMEAMAGMTALIGYPDTGPLGSGTAYLDPMGGLHGAAAVLTALVERQASGRGQRVELAQQEAAMHWIGELLLDGIENGATAQCLGNARSGACPHGPFPTRGDDEFVGIAVLREEHWAALRQILAADGVVFRHAFDRIDERMAACVEIDGTVAAWTSRFDKHAVAERLQQAGIPAAPVANGRDLFADAHLRARGWFTTLDHRQAGTHDYPGLPLVFGGLRPRPTRASPTFGQDTMTVLAEYVGLTDREHAALAAAGVTSTTPPSGHNPRRLTRPTRKEPHDEGARERS